MADMAVDKMIGGGVLGNGCVQEEIRFIICPELLAGLLFTAELQPNESLIMTGAERYSNYVGYSSSFTFTGPHIDEQERDEHNRIKVKVTGIDALQFGSGKRQRQQQYKWAFVNRELSKAYCGFKPEDTEKDPKDAAPKAVTTGNWGCGVFGGFLDLKALLQLMACAEAGKDVNYCTFGEAGLHVALAKVHALLRERNVTVGQTYGMLKEYVEVLAARKDEPGFDVNPYAQEQARNFPPDLFGFIRDQLDPPPPYEPSESEGDSNDSDLPATEVVSLPDLDEDTVMAEAE